SLRLGGNYLLGENLPNILNQPGWHDWLYQALPIASFIYLLLRIVPVFHFIRNYRFVQLIRTRGIKQADVRWRLFIQRFSSHMALRENVDLGVAELVQPPVPRAYLRPVI